MTTTTQSIDISQLPAPDVVEQLDYETILARMLDKLVSIAPEMAGLSDSDPTHKNLQVVAYRELLIRQRVNDAARAVMLAYATGTDLDCLAQRRGITRQVVDPGDPEAIPPVPAVMEDDERLRHRIRVSPNGFSTAGPKGAYEFFALGASPRVKSADVDSPTRGCVAITVLSIDGDGTPDAELLDVVSAALSDDEIRPLTDWVTVQPAEIVDYTIVADLTLYPGPDSSVVLATAQEALDKYVGDHHRLGHDITLSGIYAALHQPGVQRVELTTPSADIVVSQTQAAYCTSTTVTAGGTDV